MVCNITGKSFANLPNALLEGALSTYLESIESGSVKTQVCGVTRMLCVDAVVVCASRSVVVCVVVVARN